MHKIIAVLLSLMLTVAPVFGQSTPRAEPTPAPTFTSEQMQFLSNMLSQGQQIASSDGATINFIVVIAGIILLIMVITVAVVAAWVARGGLNSFFSLVREANKARDEAVAEKDEANERLEKEFERRRKLDEGHLETQKQYVATLQAVERTIGAPLPRMQPVVDAITANTNDQYVKITTALEAIKTDIEAIKISTTSEALSAVITPLVEPLAQMIDAALKEFHEMKPPDATAEPPPAERGTVGDSTTVTG